ncbi:MAG: hypothetical protein ABI255_09055 [Microbacteriaceae bacterium]
MGFMTSVLAESESVNALFAPAWVFGVIALMIFAALLIMVWTYRDVANRHSHTPAPDAASHAGAPGNTSHGTGHGH